jgi:hypothetical protein
MNFDNQKTYKITKIKEFNPGKIVLNYWTIGRLEYEPEIGICIFMWRFSNANNPDSKLGYFRSSRVTNIVKNKDNWEIDTVNSTYRLEENAN